jgi:hypothetical protein
VIEDYNKGITNPNGVYSGIARHTIVHPALTTDYILFCGYLLETQELKFPVSFLTTACEVFTFLHVEEGCGSELRFTCSKKKLLQ